MDHSFGILNFRDEFLEFQNNMTTTTTENPVCFQPTSLEQVSSPIGQLFLVLLYSSTALAALLGNVTVIVVQCYGSESAPNIRRYLINLAVSDIAISVLTMPFTYTSFMLGHWMFPHWLCPMASYVQLLSVFVTSITLTIIGIERYVAIMHPFSAQHQWLESHTHLMLISTWILGAAYAFIPLGNTYTKQFAIIDNTTYYYCYYGNHLSTVKRHLFVTSNLVLTFLLPLVVLICTYSSIMRKLAADQQRNTSEPAQVIYTSRNGSISANIFLPRSSFPVNNNSKTIKMMFTIILLFGLCWAPIKLYQFLLDYSLVYFCTETQFNLLVFVYFACHWHAMASSCVNPIVYSFMSTSFRKDLQKLYSKTLQRINQHQNEEEQQRPSSRQTNSSQL